MTCPDCATARAHRTWAGYRAGCQGCAARSIARSPTAHAAIVGKTPASSRDLRDAIAKALPELDAKAGRQAVWDWWQADHGAPEAAP